MRAAMGEVWTQALATILVAVITALSGVLAAYLKSRLNTEQRRKLVETVQAVVKAVEILAESQGWTSAEKKAEALKRATELTGLPEKVLDTYIEAAVLELKAAGEELTAD